MTRDAYIVDIDGTLADLSHRLHFIEKEPKDWDAFFDACDQDKPLWDVINVIQALGLYVAQSGLEIVYVTGRPQRVKTKTHKWLWDCGLPGGQIIMRKDGDHRPDTQAKKELVETLVSEGLRVAGVFEDRPSVCRIWREMGFTVFQLTDKEF